MYTNWTQGTPHEKGKDELNNSVYPTVVCQPPIEEVWGTRGGVLGTIYAGKIYHRGRKDSRK